MKKILEIDIKTITPILLGGADADYNDNLLRITPIRGMLRWVLRTIIAAASFQIGLDEIDAVNKSIGFLLGDTDRSSRIKIIFNKPVNIEKLTPNELLSNIIDDIDNSSVEFTARYSRNRKKEELRVKTKFKHQRLNLLWMDIDKQILYEIDDQGKFKVKQRYSDIFSLFRNIIGSVRVSQYKKLEMKIKWMPSKPRILEIREMKKRKQITLENQDVKILESFWSNYKQDLLNELSKRVGKIEKAKIEIYTYSTNVGVEERLIVYAIALTFLIMGLGKGARRGLGALKIINLETPENSLKFDVKSLLDRIKSIETRFDNLWNIIELTIDNAQKFLRKLQKEGISISKRGDQDTLPKIPTLSKNHSIIFVGKTTKLWETICKLNAQLFLRHGKLGLQLRKIRNARLAVRSLKHYILGLPRSAKGSSKIKVDIDPQSGKIIESDFESSNKTGFVYLKDENKEGRRASPIIISAINERLIVVTVLKSKDWPSKITWYSKRSKPQRIFDFDRLNGVYEELTKYLYDILKGYGFKRLI